jgi:hypothetical protein
VFTAYDVNETRMWSASPLDFVVPGQLQLLWGALSEIAYPRPLFVERTLYLGLVALALAAVAARASHSRQTRQWLATALCAAVLALGTDLHLGPGAEPVQAQPIWLPTYYLARLPGVGLMRTWSRFGIVTIQFVALLAGLGAAVLLRQHIKHKWMPALIAAMVIADLAPGYLKSFEFRPRAVDTWLMGQAGDGAVAFLPPGVSNYQDQYGSLFHAHRLFAHNHPTHLPQEFRDYVAIAANFPNAAAIDALDRLGVTFYIVNRKEVGEEAEWRAFELRIAATGRLTAVTQAGQHVVYAMIRSASNARR